MGIATEVVDAIARGREPAPDALAWVLQAAGGLEDVAWHPTGFVVARLFVAGSRTLRLHVWPDDERCFGEPLWPLHDHVFSLQSLVLVGSVGSRRAEVVDTPAGTHRRYAVEYGEGRSSQLVASGGTVVARELDEARFEAGAVYGVAAGEFHASAAPQGQLAATLVATEASGSRRPFVLGPVDGPVRVDVRRVPVAASRWRQLLDRVQRGRAAASDGLRRASG